ncbi:MAG: HlyC/CorC family transporter [Paludibacteraceae bacterium]|nr:HlyC/CorC family transporter [Paludibacteraceae bacterium]MBP6435820.1 HlyC/CorC family transporter [Paludibacteraceae bacterium]MBP8627071.1 HlyC/CorC family transporter [Paludibacteraceae bacterium]MBP8781747.1 HlyC/CorC family transporter [Paludibacteraceae bacterium]MBP9647990.1 HlyC/CorC family transporter [Paludibacteraceae bacterium]
MTTTVFLIFISLLFSAFFSGMEIAFYVSNKLRFEINKQHSLLSSSILSIFYANPSKYISIILVGNNIALVVYGIQMAKFLEPYLLLFLHNDLLIATLQTIFSTIVILLTGEFLPKVLFRLNADLWLKVFAIPLFLCYLFLYPVATFVYQISIFLFKILRVDVSNSAGGMTLGRADLDNFLQQNYENTTDKKHIENEVKLFQNALDFSKIKLRDCIIPRTEILAVDFDTDIEELRVKFVESGYSRILVFKEHIDNMVGYIHSIELFKKPRKWQDQIRVLPIVPETMAANKLMNYLLQKKKSMALVVDEFGGTSGMVTLEDIVEEIFGEIEDEHDTQDYVAKKISENEYVFSGRLEIDYVQEQFDIQLPVSDEYLTIAGLILHYYQGFPKINEEIIIGNYMCKVIKASANKIELIKLKVLATL